MVSHDSMLKLMSDGVTREFPELTFLFYRSANMLGYTLFISLNSRPGRYCESHVSEVFLRSNPRRVFEEIVRPMAKKVHAKECSKLARLLRGEE